MASVKHVTVPAQCLQADFVPLNSENDVFNQHNGTLCTVNFKRGAKIQWEDGLY